ncbi:MAG: NUDIX domain-containing protein [Deltaproteobacteria bacterium]|nr:MAG: NUDIX domain-containing protein [Deltaproteobacteria bacterium]
MSEEMFDLVNEDGDVIGQAPRSQCHGDPSLLHQVVHVFVVNSEGHVALQLRPAHKKIQPNRWDTSVGGHLELGEAPEHAAYREMEEELGISAPLELMYTYIWRTEIESELVYTYRCVFNGELSPDPYELAEARWWSPSRIEEELGSGQLTPNLEVEWGKFKEWQGT